MLEFIPVAEAVTISSLMNSIERVVINPLILFLFACATVYFLYGVVQYFMSPESQEVHSKSKQHMLWGLVGMLIMISTFGIMRIILNTIDEKRIDIANTGAISVNTDFGKNSASKNPTRSGPIPNPDGPSSTSQVLDTMKDFTESPFDKAYTSDAKCWRGTAYAKESTEVLARKLGPTALKVKFTREQPALASKNHDLPTIVENKLLLDAFNTQFYYWVAGVAPLEGGACEELPNSASNNHDNLALPEIKDQSDMRNAEINAMIIGYGIAESDDNVWRAVDSGEDLDQQKAQDRALLNARIQIAKAAGYTDLSKVKISPSTTPTKVWYTSDDEHYHVWTAIVVPK